MKKNNLLSTFASGLSALSLVGFSSIAFAMAKSKINPLETPPNLLVSEKATRTAAEVWNQVQSDPYTELPSASVGYFDLFKGGVSLIERAANRTLNSHQDLLPYFNKLAHPNGVCLRGEWNITEQNPYSGFFKLNSKAIIIARASVALSETEKGSLRGFGFAGKLFPTIDEQQAVATANFFLVDDLGGTDAAHYTDVEMTNEPKASKTLAVIENLAYALKIASTFALVDDNPGIRQVYEIAEAKNPNERSEVKEVLKVPHWLMLRASKGQPKIGEKDFRNELLRMLSEHGLEFEIFAADEIKLGKKNWHKLGVIEIDQAIASESCDHRLHFHHPKFRKNLGF